MFGIAQDYEKLAKRAEQRAGVTRYLAKVVASGAKDGQRAATTPQS